MTRLLPRLAGLVGLGAALWLYFRHDPAGTWALLAAANVGLLLAALAHVLPMAANARAWQLIVRDPARPDLLEMGRLVWLRESINGLLPVARIGGEVACYRRMRARQVSTAAIVGSLVVDTQLTLISQAMFAGFGVGFLCLNAKSGAGQLAREVAWGLALFAPILIAFCTIQRFRPMQRAVGFLNRAVGGRLVSALAESARIDAQLADIWAHAGAILEYFFVWENLQCLLTALELWIALRFIGSAVSFVKAVVLESLIQALSSAAFFVPANLGIQEGGFLVIGQALGIPANACLALAGSRRIRDVIIYVPGLLASPILVP